MSILGAESTSVLIVAAEQSSTLYALRILENWKSREIHVSAFGIGSEEMSALGFEIIEESTRMAVVGVGEVFQHWKTIRKAYYSILKEVEKREPKFALLLDYPGFNLRLARDLKRRGVKVIYYISPQLWAWKKGRVEIVKKYCDRMLVLFPFEKKFYSDHNYSADHVGHPLLDEITQDSLDEKIQKSQREKFGIQVGETLLGLMPGSRLGEIQLNLPVQLEAAEKLQAQFPKIKVALLLAPNLKRENVVPYLKTQIQIIQIEPFKMIGFCDLILCASGTATLMVGLMEKPMVIMYKMHPLSAWLARRLVTTKFFGLINIIAGKEIVPERFQNEASGEILASELKKILEEPRSVEIKKELAQLKSKLGKSGSATKEVLKILDEYL